MSEEILQKCRAILGEEGVISPSDPKAAPYQASTLRALAPEIIGVLKPKNKEEVVAIMRLSLEYKMPLYPISIGNNWGYGSKTPVGDGCIVLDLSCMDTIIHFDPTLGHLTVEPGVKTSYVESFLQSINSVFMAPVIGAGPSSSLIGNVLEKGTSSSIPHERVDSLVSIEVVLPDCSIYNSNAKSNKTGSFTSYKWNTGPHLDTLFMQSNLGIVTQATFQLAHRPAFSKVLFAKANSKKELGNLILALHKASTKLPGILTSYQIDGPVRSFAYFLRYPKENFENQELIPENTLKKNLHELSLGEWNCCALIQGEEGVVKEAQKVVRQALSEAHIAGSFYSSSTLQRYKRWIDKMPQLIKKKLSYLQLIANYSERSLGKNKKEDSWWLPFWRQVDSSTYLSKLREKASVGIDALPTCGFIFFSAIYSIATDFESSLSEIEQICKAHDINPSYVLVGNKEGHVRIALQISFNKSSLREEKKAFDCYASLYRNAQKEGAVVYRVPNNMQYLISEYESPHMSLAKKIKKALDPNNLLSPRRYIN